MTSLYSEDQKEVWSAFQEIENECQDFYSRWSQLALKCIDFLCGDQEPGSDKSKIWANSMATANNNVDEKLKGLRANEIEPVIKTLVSYFTRNKPTVTAYDMRGMGDQNDYVKITNKWFDASYDLNNEREILRMLAYWGMCVGTAYVKDFYNPNSGYYDENTGWMTGSNDSVVLTPFTVKKDINAQKFKDIGYIYEQYVKDVDWVIDTFTNEDDKRYTGQAQFVTPNDNINGTLLSYEELKTAVTNRGTNYKKPKKAVVITEIYVAPSRINNLSNKGRCIIYANDICVYDSYLDPEFGNPYFAIYDPIMWHPYSEYIAMPVLGRSLGKGFVEGIVPHQIRLNELIRSIAINANTIAKPFIAANKNSVKQGVLNGEHAKILMLEGDPGANAITPINGTPLPAQFFNELQTIRDLIVSEVGTNFIMQGKIPSGMTAAAALKVMLETSTNMHSDPLYAYEGAIQDHFNKKLRVFKKINKTPSMALIQKMKMISGNATTEDLNKFLGANDLSDGVNIQIESGSTMPKLNSIKAENYVDLAKSGFFNSEISDGSPAAKDFKNQILKKAGLEPIESNVDVNIKKADWENERMLLGKPVEVFEFEDHAIHAERHLIKMLDPEFIENASNEVKNTFFNHYLDTIAAQQNAMSQQNVVPLESGIAKNQDLMNESPMIQQ
jgi:hypothetical protein